MRQLAGSMKRHFMMPSTRTLIIPQSVGEARAIPAGRAAASSAWRSHTIVMKVIRTEPEYRYFVRGRVLEGYRAAPFGPAY